jgi:predicted DNA-binding transcriptional regulator AlpA
MRDPLLPRATVTNPRDLAPLAVNLQTAARLVGLSDTGLDNLIKQGKGPRFARLGARRLFRVAELERWLQEREGAPCS